jgi:hypothetical protein
MQTLRLTHTTYFTVTYVLLLTGKKRVTGYDLNKDILLKAKTKNVSSALRSSIWRYDINRSDGIRVVIDD